MFDIGGVLLDWDPRHLYRKLFSDAQAMNRFLDEICTLEWHDAHDRGVSGRTILRRTGCPASRARELIWAWARRSEEMIAGPIAGHGGNPARAQGAGVRCYALTNMEAETYPLRRDRSNSAAVRRDGVVSASKASPSQTRRSFVRLLDRFGLRPEATLLIDDSSRNTERPPGWDGDGAVQHGRRPARSARASRPARRRGERGHRARRWLAAGEAFASRSATISLPPRRSTAPVGARASSARRISS